MKWISVKDRLPENGQFVLCCFDNIIEWFCSIKEKKHDGFGLPKCPKGYVVRQLKTDDGDRWADQGVTHWMPLPDPPENT